LRLVIVGLGAALPLTLAAQATSTSSPAGGSAPLTLKATCDTRGQTPVIRVTIANASAQPAAVLLGFSADGGKAQVVNAFNVIAIRPATGADEAYVYVNPKYALTQGTPWVVSLAPGATHDLELPLFDFISSNTFANLDPVAAGGARLVLEGRPGARSPTPVWTGRVETKLDQCL
jgi:hypothetical protein